ncbi:hypothetical protein [Streptomyces albidoflavus]|uniref:hypothetical protein n=1 Tax=Streptomyces albidoflavus TaxID=1886 RepID=UPI0033CFDD67
MTVEMMGQTGQEAVDPYRAPAGLQYAVLAVDSYGLGVLLVEEILAEGEGKAKILNGGTVPMGAQPVLVAQYTAYGTASLEPMIQQWPAHVPRPWAVLLADVPGPPPVAARYRIRALSARFAGVVHLRYMPALREAVTAREAMKDKKTLAEAVRLRRAIGGTK